jgi:hypothetical protein
MFIYFEKAAFDPSAIVHQRKQYSTHDEDDLYSADIHEII